MAKSFQSQKSKTTFGKRREGKAFKRKGPKDKNIKQYKAQGR